METDAVRSQAHCRSFDLQEQRVRGADELDKKVAALDVERGSKQQQVLVVPPQELGEQGELVHAAHVDS